MSAAPRLFELEIDAFRGLSNRVRLNLRSPLTLIYAPNGTGKTTVCEAAEWLLTGQVDRLNKSGQRFDAESLTSKLLDPSRPLAVSALFWLDEAEYVLERSTSDARLGVSRTGLEQIGPADLLRLLAPAGAGFDAHHVRAISLRQQWLRGTRFLTAEALAALVDSDDETVTRRTQIFADLLGIRHLLDAERSCERYIEALGSKTRALNLELATIENEAATLRTNVGSSEPASGGLTAILSALGQAERLLDVTLSPENHDIAARIELATASVGMVQERQRQRKTALDALARIASVSGEVDTNIAALEPREKTLAAELVEIEKAGTSATAELAALDESRIIQTERQRQLTACSDSLGRKLAAVEQAIAAVELKSNNSGSVTIAALEEQFQELAWTAEQREQRLQNIRSVMGLASHMVVEFRRRDALAAQYGALKLPSNKRLSVLRATRDRTAAAAEAAKVRIDSTLKPWERLQVAGLELLAHTHDSDSGECPLCGHDWKTLEQLRDAITDALLAAPTVVRAAQEASASATKAAQEAEAAYVASVTRLENAQKLSDDLANISRVVDTHRLLLTSLGVTNIQVDPTPELQALERRLTAAIALADLLAELDSLKSTLPEVATVPRSGTFSEVQRALEEALQRVRKDIGARLDAVVENIRGKIAVRNRLRLSYSDVQSRLRDIRLQLAKAQADRDQILSLWASLNHERPWSTDALNAARNAHELRAQALDFAETQVAAARAVWDAELRRQQLEKLDADIRFRQASANAMAKRMEAARIAKISFRDAYTKVSRQQIDGLRSIVNPLFARMHANKVFDSIEFGEADQLLHWMAQARGVKFDPGTDFSQGQRQDLALALFLGRARSLGGTFFLDEPITHLDDLNRVGLLDVMRSIVLESAYEINLVVTTASRTLARHLVEKFAAVGKISTAGGLTEVLRVIELRGNPHSGVEEHQILPSIGAS